MDLLQAEIILSTILLGVLICTIAWLGSMLHRRTHHKLDDVHDEARGVRIRLERHAEESSDAHHDLHKDNKRFHAQIYRLVVEWLNLMRGK